jgi:hypothetical protein
MWDFWWTEYFGFSSHSLKPLIGPQPSISIMQGWYNRPINDRNGLVQQAPQINKKTTVVTLQNS